MKASTTTLAAALAGLAGLGVGLSVGEADAKPSWSGHEKCQGIVAKGQNDCGTSKHTCHAQATVDRDPEEWIYVPEGLCAKVAGGKLKK